MRTRKGRPLSRQKLSSAAGFEAGRSHGYRTGCCQSVLQTVVTPAYPVWPVKVLYICQGFEGIDRGVSEALSALASELIVGNPADLYRLASETRPDLVLVMNGLHVFPEDHLQMIDLVRSLGLRTAIWFVDDPYFTDFTPQIALHYDYVFTHEIGCVDIYREAGCRQVFCLPLAVSTSIFRPMSVEIGYHSDICFIGNAFPNRLQFFNQIMPFLAGHKTVILGALWNHLDRYDQLAGRIKLDWTPIDETVKYYNGAKIVINLHRGAVDPVYSKNARQLPGRSINPRTYEMSACGVLQMTDVREDLGTFYNPGSELVTYASPAEFIERAGYYLAHEGERNRIAVRGLQRTMREHTFMNRLHRMFEIIFNEDQSPQG
ncbi:MAG: spore maturation protein [Paenibacillaceae bacterium]|jgi:spore maturation protein CgeB|nr:spore maturation protein [Paenibacillaceae bacterium]